MSLQTDIKIFAAHYLLGQAAIKKE